jgi:hypothetical protein
MSEVEWSEVVGALAKCEDIPSTACGLLSFGAPPSMGGIFVEQGRVCWAAATGLHRRLTDILRDRAALRNVDVEALYLRCRAEGKPLGRALLEEDLVSLEDLEAALRLHSAESLVELCRSGLPTIWVPRRSGGYSPRLTFRPIEVLFDVVRLVHRGLQEDATVELIALSGGVGRGAAFLADESTDVMIPVAQLGEMTIRSASTLGRWVTSVTTATRELGAPPAFTLASTSEGLTISVSSHDRLVFALVCEDRASVAAVTARHLACA